jgi:hypothetical protein
MSQPWIRVALMGALAAGCSHRDRARGQPPPHADAIQGNGSAMPPQPLSHRINRVFTDQAPAGPPAVVVATGAGATPVERYRGRAGDVVPAGVALSLIVRVETLDSPDEVEVPSAERAGAAIDVAIEWRHYEGPLLGNDVTVAFVEVELGALAPGSYAVTARQLTRTFHEIGHADRATGGDEVKRSFQFAVSAQSP